MKKKIKKPTRAVAVVLDSKAELGRLFEARRSQLYVPYRHKLSDFARRVEIERSAYYRIEQGLSWPQFNGLIRILKELKLELVARPIKGSESLPDVEAWR